MKKLIVSLILLTTFSITTTFAQEKRLGLDVEVGYSEALSSMYDSYEVFVSPGIHFGEKFFAGIGIGYKRMMQEPATLGPNSYLISGDINNTPFFVHAKVSPYSFGKLKPFFSVKAGYGYISNSFTTWGMGSYDDGYGGEYGDGSSGGSSEGLEMNKKKINGGLFLSPAIGVSYSFGRFSTFSLSIAYDLQNFAVKNKTIKDNITILSEKRKETNSAIAFRLGWGF